MLHRLTSEEKNSALRSVYEWICGPLQQGVEGIIHIKGNKECQLAVYPGTGSAHYERHRDAFPVDDHQDDEQRRLTTILYLNSDTWDVEDGGHLRIHAPILGRCVTFLSGAIDHEVLPCHKDRVALTIWWQ